MVVLRVDILCYILDSVLATPTKPRSCFDLFLLRRMEYSFLALYFDNWPKISKQQKNSIYKPDTSTSETGNWLYCHALLMRAVNTVISLIISPLQFCDCQLEAYRGMKGGHYNYVLFVRSRMHISSKNKKTLNLKKKHHYLGSKNNSSCYTKWSMLILEQITKSDQITHIWRKQDILNSFFFSKAID